MLFRIPSMLDACAGFNVRAYNRYRIFFYFLGQVMGVAMRNRVTFPVKLCSLVWPAQCLHKLCVVNSPDLVLLFFAGLEATRWRGIDGTGFVSRGF